MSMSSTSILVSRSIDDSSPIMKLTSIYEIELKAASLIEMEDIDFVIPTTEWLYFYSKTGVKKFLEKCALSHYKIGSFGPETAKYISRYAPVAFQSNADTATATDQINSDDLASKMTFVCGKRSLRSVQKALEKSWAAETQELIVYDQKTKEGLQLSEYDIAVLTSPLNVQSFFKNGGLAKHYIAIGKTTAAAIRDFNINPIIASKPSEDYLAKAIKDIFGESICDQQRDIIKCN